MAQFPPWDAHVQRGIRARDRVLTVIATHTRHLLLGKTPRTWCFKKIQFLGSKGTLLFFPVIPPLPIFGLSKDIREFRVRKVKGMWRFGRTPDSLCYG